MTARLRDLPAALALLVAGTLGPAPVLADEAIIKRAVPYADLHGWDADDLPAALAVFRRGCTAAPHADENTGATAACERAISVGPGAAEAKRFFEGEFDPVEITVSGQNGFLTGYYEPEFGARLQPQAGFTAPLLSAPPGDSPRPDRAAIEDGALAAVTQPLAYLDPVDAFMIHVQGSARLRLVEGRTMRIAYAGRNGQPYTSVARLLAERLGVAPAAMDATRMVAWLKANPTEARELMRANRSYIFFRPAPELAAEDGPIGAAGVPLSAGRSLAIDPRAWPYGTPVWLEGTIPDADGGTTPLARLTIAQDTGAAIRGPARADLFLGTGPEAGRQAGSFRERVRFVVLRPRATPNEAVR